jgi:two-component system, NtrC family, nitrogen regulation response regulator GlnG
MKTLAPRTPRPKRTAPERALTLTVLYHPDPDRIGTSAVVTDTEGEMAVSRQTPRFSAKDALPRALDVAGVSRTPMIFEALPHGWRITPPANPGYTVDGQRSPQTFTDEVLEHGVVVELAGWVLLWARTGRPVLERSALGLVGCSPALGRVREGIRKVASSDAPVLVVGPSGAGKELVARAIHTESDRARQPYHTINLAAVLGSAAVSQLFGHARGAFTGAATAHRGFFRDSDRGTLLIDEIGEVADDVQPLLLRALESGEIQPLGGATAQVDVRLVFSTDADLEALVASGKFRKALYYRMNQLVVRAPALGSRPEDVALQAVFFLRETLAKRGRANLLDADRMWLTPEFMADLVGYGWPGNSRELRALMQRAVVHSADLDQIGLDEPVPFGAKAAVPEPSPATIPRRSPGADPTREELLELLREHGFQIGRTVKALSIGRNRLYQLMERHGLRTAKQLSEDEISGALHTHGAVAMAAAALEVSERGLRLRMRALGLTDNPSL